MIDIKQTYDGDLDLMSGDIVMTESTEQHKRDILSASQGDFKEYPLTGVGLIDYMSDNTGMLLRDISRQMQRDGIKVKEVGFNTSSEIVIDGSYENNNNRG